MQISHQYFQGQMNNFSSHLHYQGLMNIFRLDNFVYRYPQPQSIPLNCYRIFWLIFNYSRFNVLGPLWFDSIIHVINTSKLFIRKKEKLRMKLYCLKLVSNRPLILQLHEYWNAFMEASFLLVLSNPGRSYTHLTKSICIRYHNKQMHS